MVRKKVGVREGWRRADMVKAGYFRQSRNEWTRGSDRSDVTRAINQKDELNSFSNSPEAKTGNVLGKPAEAWTKLVYFAEKSLLLQEDRIAEDKLYI